MKISIFKYSVITALMGVSNAVLSFDIPGDDSNQSFEYVEEAPWVENKIKKFPDFPDKGDLSELPIDLINTPFRFWIDLDSIETGSDAVVRYVIQLRSSTGSQNTFFEGIRCDTYQYRIYAFGSQNIFTPFSNKRWKLIHNSGSQRYRDELVKYFFCNNLLPLSKDTILRRIRSQESVVHDEADIY